MTQRATTYPLVCDVPHAGRHYPTAEPRVEKVALQMSEDRFADAFYAPLREASIAWHEARVARTVVDVNRPRDSRAFRAHTLSGSPINVGLTDTDMASRLSEWYDPYVRSLDASLEDALRFHPWVVHLNLHTFPTVDWHTPSRPPMPFDIEIGDLRGRTSSRGLGARLETAFRDLGYRVARNDTFAGGEILRHTAARFGTAVESVQIEVCRRLYLDDDLTVSQPRLDQHQGQILGVVLAAVRAMIRVEGQEAPACSPTYV